MTRRNRIQVAVMLGVMALAAAGSRAEAQAPTLSALDYAEIQQLAARYAHAIDTCSDNGYDYARLYTSDGVFTDRYSVKGFAAGGISVTGYEALARVAGGGPGGCTTSPRWDLTHVMANHVIIPSPEGATGRVYLIEVWGGTEPSHVLRAGGYEDVYVKTPAGWRFKSRVHVRDKAWHNPGLRTPDLMSPPRPTPGPLGQPRSR
jgi:hypothetical protein